MKSTIVYLGILATMFVNTTFANGIEKDQYQNEDQVSVASNLDTKFEGYETLKKPSVESESEINFTGSVTASKSIEETIEEDKKITEYNEEIIQPLIIDRTIEEVIKEDKQIIENTVSDETHPLDFELIRKYENALKNEQFKNTAFTKTNLKS